MTEVDFSSLKIDKENDIVSYNDEIHAYWTKNSKQRCISVTTLVHRYTTFDEEFWAAYKTLEALLSIDNFLKIKSLLLDTKKFKLEYLELFRISDKDFFDRKNEILAEWAEKRETSCIRGTAIHREQELLALAGKSPEIQRLGLGGNFKTTTTNKIEPGQGVYPELLLSRISDDGKLRLAGQADLIIIDGWDVYILDFKGLDINTPILTTKGFKLLKDITTQDVIYDKDGQETNILNISSIHYNPCYKIEFDNNESIIADHEHRWLISFYRGKGKFKDVVMTTEELIDVFNKYNETKNTYYLPKIKNAKPLEADAKILPIDPYILGAWLGDGSKSCGIITNINPNFWDEVSRRGYTFGENLSGEDRAEMRTIYNLRHDLVRMNLLNNKHIPIEYMLASYEQKLDLLRGLMDTDGHYNVKRKRFVMGTTQKWQAYELHTLLATMGVKSTVIPCTKVCGDKKFQWWDTCFTMEDNPFLIRNQEGIEYPKIDKASFRVIKNISLVETIPTKCLEVDSPSHTFLFGYGLIPTHNTNKKIDLKSFYDRKLKKSQKLKYPLNHIDDANFWHYTLQLSTYAWMIQKIDPRFNIKLLQLIHYDHDGNVTEYECEYRKQDVERMLVHYKKETEYEEFKKTREKINF